MERLQEKAAAFARSRGLNLAPTVRFLDLASEVGELSKELLKASGYGAAEPKATPEMAGELGDCLFSLLCLAEGLGLDAQAALDGALEKYGRRAAATGQVGSGR